MKLVIPVVFSRNSMQWSGQREHLLLPKLSHHSVGAMWLIGDVVDQGHLGEPQPWVGTTP